MILLPGSLSGALYAGPALIVESFVPTCHLQPLAHPEKSQKPEKIGIPLGQLKVTKNTSYRTPNMTTSLPWPENGV